MELETNARKRLPKWMNVPMQGGPKYLHLRKLVKDHNLHTVCEEARCPNIGECWERGTATFMILGDICTRRCHYCAVKTARPRPVDSMEPERLARTIKLLKLDYCVITSVNRDDLPDGGAEIFASCISKIKEYVHGCRVEVLVPDFEGNWEALRKVLEAGPDVLNHNIETVKRVFPKVRPKGRYERSLELLGQVKKDFPELITKSGLMVGLGEEWDEIIDTFSSLRSVSCDSLTIGQYLRPSAAHYPMERFYSPNEFDLLRKNGLDMGFSNVYSGPLVRSSYHAESQAANVGLGT